MPFLYILECADGTYYVGSTIDLARRLEQHREGAGATYTKRRRPVRLVYFEVHEHIGEAFGREKRIHDGRAAKSETSSGKGRVDGLTTMMAGACISLRSRFGPAALQRLRR
jgi:putative endonuclease